MRKIRLSTRSSDTAAKKSSEPKPATDDGTEPASIDSPARLSRHLTAREQLLLSSVARRGRVTAAELEAELQDRLHNSTIRTHLRALVTKGHLRYVEEDGRFVYSLSRVKAPAAGDALRAFVLQFFGGEATGVFAELIPLLESEHELNEVTALLEAARRRQQNR